MDPLRKGDFAFVGPVFPDFIEHLIGYGSGDLDLEVGEHLMELLGVQDPVVVVVPAPEESPEQRAVLHPD